MFKTITIYLISILFFFQYCISSESELTKEEKNYIKSCTNKAKAVENVSKLVELVENNTGNYKLIFDKLSYSNNLAQRDIVLTAMLRLMIKDNPMVKNLFYKHLSPPQTDNRDNTSLLSKLKNHFKSTKSLEPISIVFFDKNILSQNENNKKVSTFLQTDLENKCLSYKTDDQYMAIKLGISCLVKSLTNEKKIYQIKTQTNKPIMSLFHRDFSRFIAKNYYKNAYVFDTIFKHFYEEYVSIASNKSSHGTYFDTYFSHILDKKTNDIIFSQPLNFDDIDKLFYAFILSKASFAQTALTSTSQNIFYADIATKARNLIPVIEEALYGGFRIKLKMCSGFLDVELKTLGD